MFTHAHLYNPNMWLIIVGISRKVEAVFAVSVPFLSPMMSRNSNRNKNSTHYEVIIQFWRLSKANRGKSRIDKNMYKGLNLHSFLLMKLQRLFSRLCLSPNKYISWALIRMLVNDYNYEIVSRGGISIFKH